MPNDDNLIKESFAYLVPKKARVVNAFYARLFKVAPELKALFSEKNASTQIEMLMGALSLAVKVAKDDFFDMSYFKRLGERHRKYDFDLKYFEIFNDCLLMTIEEAMGQSWSPAMREQWLIVLQKVTQAMTEGMKASEDAKLSS